MPLSERKKPEADLRRTYTINMQIGLIIILLVLIGLFRLNLDFNRDLNFQEQPQRVVQLEDIIQTTQQKTPPPPPRPRMPEEVPNDEILEDDFFDFDFDDGQLSHLPPPPPPVEEDEDEGYEIFEVVEDEPYPLGGLDAIYSNLRYPEIARRAGIEGVVIIQFVVDEHGNVSQFNVLRDIGGGTANAAIEAIQQTEWAPGRQRGRAVPVRFQIPVRFMLHNR